MFNKRPTFLLYFGFFFNTLLILLSHADSFVTLWTVAHQTPLPMEFSKQAYWSELPFPSPGDLPDQGIEPWSPALQADSLPSEPPEKPHISIITSIKLYFKDATVFLY